MTPGDLLAALELDPQLRGLAAADREAAPPNALIGYNIECRSDARWALRLARSYRSH
jgi:hypothetical protein